MEPFVPHPWFPGGDLQTLGTRLFQPPPLAGEARDVDVGAGDRLRVLVNRPAEFAPGGKVLVLVHGMTGSTASAYMIRMAEAALAGGAAVVRVNLRNCGEGAGLSRLPYHSGRSGDLRAVLAAVARWFPGSPVGLIGYSLGGNVALKLAGELPDHPAPNLAAVATVAAPIDLAAAADALARPRNLLYDQYFVRGLKAEAERLASVFPEAPAPVWPRRMTVRTFDDLFTAPRSGFRDAADYYAKSSSSPLLERIPVPALLITAADDPFVPVNAYRDARLSPQVTPLVTRRGGHCAYIARQGGAVSFWAEERAVDFVRARL